ncbi:Transcriptional regulator, TetR family [[Actinomadura] parvosata subsp. kistnae]|uniref:TetR family transcriptional regulator n=1 Tax=[Actinomadura] parvosata subsp. kistnae TaxID=1909395 RepID=A0A1U9ZW54_9ACTN|nr:TetR/AcrR family transcriptional regulator [Nonomuraea sp. ATCC 55076]AQZ62191.1 TetR family transcriptional regulator [Nonomuraea sp. ATCC 55076]SPL95952.1 Transcriptional regulator, TetR family [Actinomadura parvosata subsp. kistnae]
MNGAATREHIVEAADRLFYQRGYEHTSFADIAAAVGLSRGNFYYHFKSKDAILDAVIATRLAGTRHMLRQWENEHPTPSGRILRFVEIVLTNGPDIQQYGCPVGTLNTELAKLGHTMRGQARELFTLFRDWLREQFTELGHADQADELAMHVLAFSQGVAVLSHAFADEEFVRREVSRMRDWLSTYEK